MKDKAKPQRPKAVPFKTKSYPKIVTNKENIKSQEPERRRVTLLEPSFSKKTDTLQSSLRHRKRRDTRLESKTQ